MALKLHTTYPGRFDSPSENYPQGKWRNRSNSTAHDGGYLEEKHMNDIYGFFGALLRNAEMSPNGEVDTAKKSQFYDALVAVAKKAVGEDYRKLDDNVFNGYLQVRSEHEGQGTGVFLQDTDGTVRGQVVATDQGLQLTQYPKDGGSQTFTFPSEGGEVLLDSTLPKDLRLFKSPQLRASNIKLEKSFIPMAYIPQADGSAVFMAREGDTHYPHGDAKIYTYITNDGMTTLENKSLFMDKEGVDVLNSTFGRIDDNYYIVMLENIDGIYQAPYMLKTKDGKSFNKIQLNKSAELATGFSALPVGGVYEIKNMTDTFAIFFYSNNKIGISITRDRGETWSDIDLIIRSNSTKPISEMALFQCEEGYTLLMRQGSDLPALASTSTNLMEWSSLVSTKLMLGASPLFSYASGDNEYLVVVDRNNHIVSNYRNIVATYNIDSKELFESPSEYSFDNFDVVAQLPHWGVGTIKKLESINGKPMFLINAWEQRGNLEGTPQWSQGGTLNGLFVLSDVAGTESPAIYDNIPKKNYLTNSNFRIRSFGNTGEIGTSTRVTCADAWGIRFSGGKGSGRYEITDKGLTFYRNEGNSDTNHINLVNVINNDVVKILSNSWVNLSIDYNAKPESDLLIYLYYSAEPLTGLGTTDGSFPGNKFIVSQPLKNDLNSMSFNAFIPEDAHNLVIRVLSRPKGVASVNEEVTIHGVYLTKGFGRGRIIEKTLVEEEIECSRYFQKSSYLPIGSEDSRGTVRCFNAIESSRSITHTVKFPVNFYRSPRVTIYTPDGVVDSIYVIPDGYAEAIVELISKESFTVSNSVTIPSSRVCAFHWKADAHFW